MIPWWWLAVEAIMLLAFGARMRGATRILALCDALECPDKARAEIARRWRIPANSLLYRYRAILPENTW